MKLLFKSASGSDEIKELLGFVDADLTFNNLMPDLRTASRQVINIIGREVYDYAIEKYNNGQIEESEDNNDYLLVQCIKYAIAVDAYRHYAPSNDLSHTNDGRKMRNEEHEKNAFEWMIDRDNDALEKRYYRALEDLIIFLDELKAVPVVDEAPEDLEPETGDTIYELWKNSDSYKKSHKLFVRSTNDFEDYFPIHSRLLLLKLQNGLSRCERYEIAPRLTNTVFEELKHRYSNQTEITDPKELRLIDLIKETCCFYALAWAIPKLSINIFPDNIVQKYHGERATTKASMVPALNESEWARSSFEMSYQKSLREIEDLLKPAVDPTDTIVSPNIISDDHSFSAI